jgi:hypothetical protein
MTPCAETRQRCVHCRTDHAVLVGQYCLINYGCAVAAVGRSYASHSACASHAIACKLGSLAQHRGLPIRPHAGHRAVLGIGERAEMLSYTALAPVPDVLRSLVKLSDVSLDHRPRDYAALDPCGVGPTLVKVNLAYHAIADADGELPAHGRGGPDPPPCRAPRGAEPARAEPVGRLRVSSPTRRARGARKARRCSDERDLEVPCLTRPCDAGRWCAIGPG